VANIIRAKVTIQGTRTLLQHHFGPDAIPLEKGEKTGVAGNDPEEWRKTCMMTEDRRLFLPGTYVFSCLKNGAVHTKKGRGTLQGVLVSTLQIEEDVLLLNRKAPPEEQLKREYVLTPHDPSLETFIYVATVRNPATKGRNVRYRMATRAGWKCKFTLCWDKTVVSRDQMKAVLRDSGMLGGLGDGIKIGCGRFDVMTWSEVDDAEETTASRDLGEHEANGVDTRRKKVRSM
jgi:DNA-binding HxlR family transcriptional regulator